jgi:hypothetical protein
MEEITNNENLKEENKENFEDKNINEMIENEMIENEMIEEMENKAIENKIENIMENTQDEKTISEATTSLEEVPEDEIDIETIRKMLGEVRRIPERKKTQRKYYEEDKDEEDIEERESLDFTLISEALYNVYAQGLKWATYVIVSRIAPGLETRVIRELSLPKSAQKQIVKALNKVLQKRFAQWAIQLSEEGTLVALLMFHSTTYITQAVMLAYQLKTYQSFQDNNNKSNNNIPNGKISAQNENIQTEKPKRRRGRPPKRQKTETTESTETTEA